MTSAGDRGRCWNERMLAAGVDLVPAFHPELTRSKGTKHRVWLARQAGTAVRVITT